MSSLELKIQDPTNLTWKSWHHSLSSDRDEAEFEGCTGRCTLHKKLTYPPKKWHFEEDFSDFPKVGYVSSLEGMSLFFLCIEKYMCCISVCLCVKNNGKCFNGASCHFWIGFLPSISRQSPAVNFWEDWGTYTRNHKGQHCSLAIRKLGNHPKKNHDLLVEVPFCSAVYVSLCFGGG